MTTTVEANGRRWRLSFSHRERDRSLSRRYIRTRDGDLVNARTCTALLLVSDLDGQNEFPACNPGVALCKPPDVYSKETGRRLALGHLERHVNETPGVPAEAFLALKNAYYSRSRGPRRKPAPAAAPRAPETRRPVRWGLSARLLDWCLGRAA